MHETHISFTASAALWNPWPQSYFSSKQSTYHNFYQPFLHRFQNNPASYKYPPKNCACSWSFDLSLAFSWLLLCPWRHFTHCTESLPLTSPQQSNGCELEAGAAAQLWVGRTGALSERRVNKTAKSPDITGPGLVDQLKDAVMEPSIFSVSVCAKDNVRSLQIQNKSHQHSDTGSAIKQLYSKLIKSL